MLGCSQVGKATGFGPVIRGFESFRPSQNFSCVKRLADLLGRRFFCFY